MLRHICRNVKPESQKYRIICVNTVTKWAKRAIGALLALAALVLAIRTGRHKRRQTEREQEAARLERDKSASVARARAAQHEAKAAKHAANASLAAGRAKIEKLKDRTDANFAARVERLSDRLRNG